jgi:hypothetical protein
MVGIETWDVEGFRKRIQAMTDEQLIRCGKAVAIWAIPAILLAEKPLSLSTMSS